MAIVTGLTAERMLAIEGASIVNGSVDANGNLILSKKNGTQINAGNVKGPAGPRNIAIDPPELNPLTKTLTPGTVQGYRRTTGAFDFRIDNRPENQKAVGIVALIGPTASPTSITISLLDTGLGHSIQSLVVWTRKFFSQLLLMYWLEGTSWQVAVFDQFGDDLGSISVIPIRRGQISFSGNDAYISMGTTATTDWVKFATKV